MCSELMQYVQYVLKLPHLNEFMALSSVNYEDKNKDVDGVFFLFHVCTCQLIII